MKKISNDLKAGIWYTIGNFVNRGIAFLSTPVFTRMLSKEAYGEFSNFTAWVTLLGVITSLDLYVTVSRAYFDYEEDFDSYMSTISWLSIVFTGLCYLVVLCFRVQAVDWLGMPYRYIHMLFLYLFFFPATQFFMIQQRMQGKYKSAILVGVGSSLLSLGISVITVLTFSNKVWGRIVGYVLPVVVVNLVIYALFFSKEKRFVRERAKYALAISVPMIPHNLSGGILTNSDRFVIKRYCGNVDLAVYSFAYNCSMVVSVLSTSINQAHSPWLYRKLNNNDIDNIRQHGERLLLLFLALVFGAMLLVPELAYVLGGEKYLDSVYLIPIIMLGYCFQFLYTYYVNLEMYCKKTITISVGTLCAAGVNVVLNFIFVPRIGYWFAAVTTLISYIAMCLIHYAFTRKIPYKDIYDHKKMAYMIIAFSICSIGVEYLYNFLLLRYFVILLYFVIACGLAYKYLIKNKGGV